MKLKRFIPIFVGLFATSVFANPQLQAKQTDNNSIKLYQLPGFFRFTFDNVKMPNNIPNMGFVGVNYFADLNSIVYFGVGAYGAVTGSQGGFFTLGLESGFHHPIINRLWGDAGVFVGGGGGRSSLVGGGLMVRPHIGLQYNFDWIRLGVHYSYITFPDGGIHSSQVGLDLDIPYDFNYVSFKDVGKSFYTFKDMILSKDKFLTYQRNDFSLLVQAYIQKKGTLNVSGQVQDGTIGLVGAELDHYLTENLFWSIKSAGAFAGMPNGYMDVLGGVGYRLPFTSYDLAIVPQFFAGAGGGGNADTGGGILLQPQVGLDVPLTNSFAARLNGGYLWSAKGQMKAATVTGMLIYHLDLASATNKYAKPLTGIYQAKGWRVQLLNQTYIRPVRAYSDKVNSSINLVAVQIDQLFNPYFFFSYQGASAYSGDHTGGLATGMIGPGVQTGQFFKDRMHLFGSVLIGAGGGGGLALGGGAIVSPIAGFHYAFTPDIGLQASYGWLKALHHNLSTGIANVGITFSFGMLEKKN